MPTITTSGSATAKAFGFTLGGAGKYFMSLLQPVGTPSVTFAIANKILKISKNFFTTVGTWFTGSSSTYAISTANFSNKNASFQSAVNLSSTPPAVTSNKATADASGNIYIAGYGYGPYVYCTATYNGNNFYLIKLDSSGNFVSTATIADVRGDGWNANEVIVDGSYVYSVAADAYYGGGMLFNKYDLSLNLISSLTYSGTHVGMETVQISNEYAGKFLLTNIWWQYTCCCIYYYDTVLQLVDSSNLTGTPTFTKRVYVGGANAYVAASNIDASGNSYVFIFSGVYSGIVKLNNAGVVQWYTQFTTTGSSVNSYTPTKIRFDNAGYLYFATSMYQSSTNTVYGAIVKINSSNGNIQFARALFNTTSGANNLYVTDFDLKDDIMYLAGATDNNKSQFVFKAPADGSLTQSFTLASSNFNYTTASITGSAQTTSTNTITPTPTLSTTTYFNTATFSSTSGSASPTQAVRIL